MKEFKYTITDPEGIHARPAGELVKVCKEFACKITLTRMEKRQTVKDLWLDGSCCQEGTGSCCYI